MSATTTPDDSTKEVQRRHRSSRVTIALPDGDFLVPRTKFADDIGVNERTVARMNLPTVYISGIAYVRQKAGLKILGDSAKRRNPPQKRRRA
jgi:hypothetical protein